MYLYSLIIENRELIKFFYGLIIVLICSVIVLRTDRLYRISLHSGIRYFRNAFFFYGIGFFTRYIFGSAYFAKYFGINISSVNFLFEYFLIMGGFFLIYSLSWKKFDPLEKDSLSSLFNKKAIVFYLMTFVIVFLDYLWKTYTFMFLSQVILFAFASIISYKNYRKNKTKKFPKFYFIAMVLSLSAWILNAIAGLLLNWHYGILINIYLLNMIVFLLFLYGIVKVTQFSD